MVLTPSTMISLGTKAIDFELLDVGTGKKVFLHSFKKARGLLIMFVCRHCPYVKHLEKELAQLGKDYAGADVGIVAISSNDAKNFSEDAPEKLKEMAQNLSFTFPFLYDESQAAAKSYQAACTPDFFLLDSDFKLVYRGQFDDSRPGNNLPVTGKHLRAALDDLIAGRTISNVQKPSLGCNIKWKPNSEPDYFKGT